MKATPLPRDNAPVSDAEAKGHDPRWRGVCIDLTADRAAPDSQPHRDAGQVLGAPGRGIAGLDADGRVEFVDAALAGMLGRSVADLLGTSLLDAADPAEHPALLAAWRVCQEGETTTRATRLRHPSAGWIDVDLTSAPRYRGTALAGLLAIVTDRSAHRPAELEGERLLDREREARAQAERAATQAARLQVVTAALSGARTAEAIAGVIVTQGAAALGAGAGFTSVVTPDRRELQLVGATGYADDFVEHWPRTPLETPTPITDAVRSGEPVWITSPAALEARYPHLATLPSPTGSRAFAALPLWAGGEVIGALGFNFAEERDFSPADRAFIATLSQQCAQALERAQLYEAEHAARLAAEVAQARLTILAAASDTLASSLDYETTLRSIAHVMVPTLAAWCAVDLADGMMTLRRRLVAHADPAKPKVVRMLRRSELLDPPTAEAIAVVLHTNRAALSPEAPAAIMEALTTTTADLARIRRLPAVSRLIVPLAVRDRRLGALTLITAESREGRGYCQASRSSPHRRRGRRGGRADEGATPPAAVRAGLPPRPPPARRGWRPGGRPPRRPRRPRRPAMRSRSAHHRGASRCHRRARARGVWPPGRATNRGRRRRAPVAPRRRDRRRTGRGGARAGASHPPGRQRRPGRRARHARPLLRRARRGCHARNADHA